MDGRDSKKGGRQNGFCRPRVKEPQLRSLNADTAAVSSWHLSHGRTEQYAAVANRTRMPLSTTAGQG